MGNISNIKNVSYLLSYLLGADIVMGVITLVSTFFEYKLLNEFLRGAYTNQDVMVELANQSDTRQQIIAISFLVLIVVTIITFCVWIFRMNKNLEVLGAADLRFSPGWAVGWFFIPIANLWKPYQAMSDLWRASKAPDSWHDVERGSVLPWWWAFWLVSNAVSNGVFRLSLKAETLEQLISLSAISMLSCVLDILATILAYILIRQIYKSQAVWMNQTEHSQAAARAN